MVKIESLLVMKTLMPDPIESELTKETSSFFTKWLDKDGQCRKQIFLRDNQISFEGYYSSDGQRHRLAGPALIQGSKKEWWVEGQQILCHSQEEFEQYLKLKAFW